MILFASVVIVVIVWRSRIILQADNNKQKRNHEEVQ